MSAGFVSAAQIIEEAGIKDIRLPPGIRLFGERQQRARGSRAEDEPWRKRPRLSELEKQALTNRAVLFINTAVRRDLDGLSRARLQTFMRTSPDAAEEVFFALQGALEYSADARVSLRLFAVADYLFMRSGAFRSLAVEHVSDLFFARCCDVEYARDARSAVPNPLFAAGRLITYSRGAVARWAAHFGARYPQLCVAASLMNQFLSRRAIKSNYNHEKTKADVLRILESAASGEYYQLKASVEDVVKTVDGCFNVLVPNLEIEGSFLYDFDEGDDSSNSFDELFPWSIEDDEDANRMYGIQGDDEEEEIEENYESNHGENEKDDEENEKVFGEENENENENEESSDVPFLFFDESLDKENPGEKSQNGKGGGDVSEIFSFSDLFSDEDDDNSQNEGEKGDSSGPGDDYGYVVPGFVGGCTELVIELSDDGAAGRVSETSKACVGDKLDECEKSMERRLIPKVKAWIRDIDYVKVDRLYDEPVLVRRLRECRDTALGLLAKMEKKRSQRKQLKC